MEIWDLVCYCVMDEIIWTLGNRLDKINLSMGLLGIVRMKQPGK